MQATIDYADCATLIESRFPYWTFHPLFGLSLQPDDGEPRVIFGDATILSREEVMSFGLHCPPGDRDEEREKILGVIANVEMAESFIAIGSHSDTKEAMEKVNERALEIASGLSLTSLHLSYFDRSIVRTEELTHFPSTTKATVHLPTGSFGYSNTFLATESHIILNDYSIISTSRAELLDLLQRPYSKGIFRTIIAPSAETHGGFRELIRNSTIHMYKAHLAQVPEVQIIGSVTAIDMLLGGEDGETSKSFNTIKCRLKCFIGSEQYRLKLRTWERFPNGKPKDIFDIRHDAVHRGASGNAASAFLSIGAATSLILAVASVAERFSSIQEFRLWIDIKRSLSTLPRGSRFHALATETDISIDGTFFDWLSRFLVNRWIWRPWVLKNPEATDDEKRKKFMEAVTVHALATGTSTAQSYQLLSSLSLIPPPDISSEDLENWDPILSDGLSEAQKTLHLLTKYESWHLVFAGLHEDSRDKEQSS